MSTARSKSSAAAQGRRDPHEWTFLTNHAHVLVCISGDPESRVRDIAERVGITERAVARILVDLEDAGYIVRKRDGRRTSYHIHSTLPLRHPLERHRRVSALLDAVLSKRQRSRS